MTVTDIEDVLGKSSNVAECSAKISTPRNFHHEEFVGDSFLPSAYRVFIKTWGCSHNNSDSEYMAGQLAAAGYEITSSPSMADLWLLNSCTVKTPSEDMLRNYVKQAVGDINDKPLVLAGCVPQAAPNTDWIKGISIIGVQQIDKVVEVVEETLRGNTVRILSSKRSNGRRLGGARLDIPKIRKNALIEILPISTGCLNACTYCKTKAARGTLASYSIQELVDRAKQSYKEGVREIWLTSEDLGAYGRDLGVTLPDLLVELVNVIPNGCMMRLGMTNPPYILDHLPEIVETLKHDRVYGFLHIPVQSGSNSVLRDMKREYTSEHFCQIVDYIRDNVSNAHIATDIICAFPTESEDDFEESYNLIEKYSFRSVFINQFYPRPGTPAASMKRINTQEARRRTKKLSDLFRSYEPYTGREGQQYDVLITEWASDNKMLVAHNKSYEQILIDANGRATDLLGYWVQVIIVSTTKYSMVGEIVKELTDLNATLPPVAKNKLPRPNLAKGQQLISLPASPIKKDVIKLETPVLQVLSPLIWLQNNRSIILFIMIPFLLSFFWLQILPYF